MENSLMHWRTKGSKNGQRLYQNEDGTWTTVGKERRRAQYEGSNRKGIFRKGATAGLVGAAAIGGAIAGASAANKGSSNDIKKLSDEELKSANTRAVLEKNYLKNIKETEKDPSKQLQDMTRSIGDATNAAKKIADVIDKPEKIHYDLSNMTDAELQKAVNRLDLERRYTEAMSRNVEPARNYLKETLEVAGGLATIAGSAIIIAKGIKDLRSK